MNPAQALADADPEPDTTPAPEVAAWLINPSTPQRVATYAELLGADPEWTGPDEDFAYEVPEPKHDNP